MARFCKRIGLLHVFALFFSLNFSEYGFLQRVLSLGINYGQLGNNLLEPEKVVHLLTSLNITKARIYDTNPQILTAFSNSNIELLVTIENQMLPTLTDPQQSLQWVTTHIKPYFPATKITGIAVGNEVFTDTDATLLQYLVPAITNIHSALVQLNIHKYIQISTPNSLAVLSQSYPPSAGTFNPEVITVISQLLQFLSNNNAPFWINAYPYFAYKDSPKKISLDYVLLNSNEGMIDPYTKLRYDNMLYAQVDAVIFAMARLGYGGIEVRVSETGWPSKGDVDEIGATVQNAAVFNRNLFRRQLAGEGTPLRRNASLEIYLFALFNENMKPGPTSERNYGLFKPDGTSAYNVELSPLRTSSSISSSTFPYSSDVISSTNKVTKMTNQVLMCLMIIQILMRRYF